MVELHKVTRHGYVSLFDRYPYLSVGAQEN